MSRLTSPIDIDDTLSQASSALFVSSSSAITNPFQRMIASPTAIAILSTESARDTCPHPVPVYNEQYNPNQPTKDHPSDYSLYANREPLFNDCPIKIVNLL